MTAQALGSGADLADGGWHRMHKLTPAIRSWRVLVVVLVVIVQGWGDSFVRGEGLPDLRQPGLAWRWIAGAGAIVVLVVGVGMGLAVLSWRMTRFRITADAVEVYSGVLFRQHRRARLDRLQAVDVVQPFVARVFGVAKLKVEVAGGNGSEVNLSYLTEEQARSLRNHLLARAAGVAYDTPEAPEAPEHGVLEVGVPRLVGSLLLSGAAAGFGTAAVGLLAVSIMIGHAEPLLGVGPGLLGLASALWARFNSGFGFRVATSPDGIRLRHGLLEHRTQTVPPGRVQAVEVSQPLLWRPADWWTLRVNVAGYGGSDRDDRKSHESTLLTVGSRSEAVRVLALVLADLGVGPGENPMAVVDRGLSGTGAVAGYLTAPPSARWLDPVGRRRIGVRVTEQALLISHGRLGRHFVVVPHARTQSVGISQGPLQRRLGLASFQLHSTPGPVVPVVQHLAAGQAAALLDEQVRRAREARAAAGPERWMEAQASASNHLQ